MPFQYKTGLANTPPVSPGDRSVALAGLIPQAPVYGQNFADNAMALGVANMAKYNAAADRANAEYDLAQQSAERQLVSQGLQMLADQRQQQRDSRVARLRAYTGLLGGLFQ